MKSAPSSELGDCPFSNADRRRIPSLRNPDTASVLTFYPVGPPLSWRGRIWTAQSRDLPSSRVGFNNDPVTRISCLFRLCYLPLSYAPSSPCPAELVTFSTGFSSKHRPLLRALNQPTHHRKNDRPKRVESAPPTTRQVWGNSEQQGYRPRVSRTSGLFT